MRHRDSWRLVSGGTRRLPRLLLVATEGPGRWSQVEGAFLQLSGQRLSCLQGSSLKTGAGGTARSPAEGLAPGPRPPGLFCCSRDSRCCSHSSATLKPEIRHLRSLGREAFSAPGLSSLRSQQPERRYHLPRGVESASKSAWAWVVLP